MKRTALTLSVLAALAAGSAIAQDDAAPSAADTFKSLDTDQSGTISPAEASSLKGLADKFAEVDADGDGEVAMAEFEAFNAE